MVTLEDQDRLGRLFDMMSSGLTAARFPGKSLAARPRTCLLCKEPAHALQPQPPSQRGRAHGEIGHILKDLY